MQVCPRTGGAQQLQQRAAQRSCVAAAHSHAGPVYMQVSSRLGAKLAPSVRSAAVRPFQPARAQVVVRAAEERLRLNNLKPAPGSRRKETRKGRGHAAGQVRAVLATQRPLSPCMAHTDHSPASPLWLPLHA